MSLNKRAETHTLSLTKSAAGSNFAPARISYIDFEIDFVGLVNVVFINWLRPHLHRAVAHTLLIITKPDTSPSNFTHKLSRSLVKSFVLHFLLKNSGEPRAAQEIRPLWVRFGEVVGLHRVRVRLRVQVRVRPPLQQTAQRVSRERLRRSRCRNTKMNEIVALFSAFLTLCGIRSVEIFC